MTDLARDKIREAEFFLDKLRETTESDAFRFYLSAFLSATWSVFDHLNTEWKGSEGFDDWYLDRKKVLKSDQFYNFMRNARHCVAHYGRPQTKTNIDIQDIRENEIIVVNKGHRSEFVDAYLDGEEMTWMARRGETVTILLTSSDTFSDKEFEIDSPRYFTGSEVGVPLPEHYSGVTVTEMCEEYLEEMRSIVEVAEEKFDYIPCP